MNKVKFQDLPESVRKVTVRAIVARMYQAYQVTTFEALAQQFNISVSTVKRWELTGTLPMQYIFQCHCDTGFAMDWLVQNTQSVYMVKNDPSAVKALTKVISKDLHQAIGFRLIVEKSDGGLDKLAAQLSTNLLAQINTME